MKTSKSWAVSLLVAAFAGSCTHQEEPFAADVRQAMQVSAGIGEATRAVIDADYSSDLNIAFARLDEPATVTSWLPAINAVRAGGTGNTAITFSSEQKYPADDKSSALIGYYPRATITKEANPATVSYTITGTEDIMATELLTGKTSSPFTPFTFRHELTQLQFRCAGSAEAISKWTAITSITVKNVSTALTLSLDKTNGASLTATGTADKTLLVANCPRTLFALNAENPATGYLMLVPAATMGTAIAPLLLEVKATYSGVSKTLSVPVSNIDGGTQAGQSHLITLTFAPGGTITAAAGIAEWEPGDGGSSTVTPDNE